ncbi:hypothetical protein TrST_g1779 [Triparma strigata]|uniref:SUI1 domain-containing protein n=1 Tax=Triparma strigata TaxID=1606541 RepID=A0A9W7BZH4_9STRA|nr:hypothetical protein TrST_g1779 [Triparma strigata]
MKLAFMLIVWLVLGLKVTGIAGFAASNAGNRPKKIKIDITGGISSSVNADGGGKVVWDGSGGGGDLRKDGAGSGGSKSRKGAKGAKKERIAKQRGGDVGGGMSVKAAKRGGKTVTIISGANKLEGGLNTLKILKSKLATGGMHVDNCIEVQGDHVDKVKKLLGL